MFQQHYAAFSTNGIFLSYVLTIMPHIISPRLTQYQAQVITGVTICGKFINSLIILASSRNSQKSRGSGLSSPPAPSSPLPYPFHQYFNSELVNSWLWNFWLSFCDFCGSFAVFWLSLRCISINIWFCGFRFLCGTQRAFGYKFNWGVF